MQAYYQWTWVAFFCCREICLTVSWSVAWQINTCVIFSIGCSMDKSFRLSTLFHFLCYFAPPSIIISNQESTVYIIYTNTTDAVLYHMPRVEIGEVIWVSTKQVYRLDNIFWLWMDTTAQESKNIRPMFVLFSTFECIELCLNTSEHWFIVI